MEARYTLGRPTGGGAKDESGVRFKHGRGFGNVQFRARRGNVRLDGNEAIGNGRFGRRFGSGTVVGEERDPARGGLGEAVDEEQGGLRVEALEPGVFLQMRVAVGGSDGERGAARAAVEEVRLKHRPVQCGGVLGRRFAEVGVHKEPVAGVLRIAARVASRLSSERKARIFSPGRFTTTSATIVSSEKTRSAMKSLTVSAVAWMSPIGTCGPLGAAAWAIWFRPKSYVISLRDLY